VRHAHAASNDRDVVSCAPPGEGLTADGIAQGRALGEALAETGTVIDLGVSSRLERARATLELALGGREVARLVLADLDDIHFGAYDGGPLAAYREWAWSTPPDVAPPGGGESRAAAALRVARALDALAARPEDVVLAVGHALPVRYALDAAAGLDPSARITPVPHATAHALDRDAVERAADRLRAWAAAPCFVPFRG
jgi:broad specificity phosphatase PhoE